MLLDGLVEWFRVALEQIPPEVLVAVAFLAGAVEATPLLGIIVPANSIVFLLGLHWAARGVFPTTLILGYAFGSFVGDVVVYVAGRRFGLGFMERWPGLLRLSPERRMALEKLFDAHGVKAVVIGRIQPVTRSFAPYVAGAARLSPSRFFAAAAIASVGMAVVVVLGGWLTGIGLAAVGQALGWVMMATVLAAAGLALLYFWLSHKLRLVTHTTLSLTLAAGMVAGLFVGLLVDVVQTGDWTRLEAADWPHGLRNVAALDFPGYILSVLGHAYVLALAAGGWAGWMYWRRRRREAFLLGAAGPALVAVVAILQLLLPRTPPDGAASWWVLQAGWPEASAAVAASLSMAGLWLWRRPGRRPWKRHLAAWGAGLGVALVAAGPLLSGRAWPTEVVAGLALGTLWGCAVLLADVAYQRKHATPWADVVGR